MADRALNLDDFLSRFQLLRPQPSRHALNQRQAAVLVPIVRRLQPGLLLTQRSPLLRKHAGQVAFPGGAVDNTDATLIAAALREARKRPASQNILVGLSGRGDKDLDHVTAYLKAHPQ